MFWRSSRHTLVAVAMVALVSGCTVNGPDRPAAVPDTPTSESTAQRPSDLALVGKSERQLCSLLTPEQQTELDVSRPQPVGDGGESDHPGCTWLGPPGVETGLDVSLSAVPSGLDEFKEDQLGEGFPETAASYPLAGGFPAEQAQNNAGMETFGCSVAVDVADEQTMLLHSGPLVPGAVSNARMCEHAKRAAGFAVGNLRARTDR
ncbi:DUF3558 domain-containing protein [Parasphingorhabdus pacifica]